ncbi:CHASE2 domain-containing protein [Rhodobacteraceae bacterium RKSG542]|uniref:CHASE2 domain-containing protein n=1 Tax=Pseudovibrio flavus TaxID=2529854 RepID=UPI0012BB8058|nr:CHASE2 domain-containing protein [Pseudovibrio flavus]MTI16616.1 CHASE2 domain-containing protein [Pseudovibrio flavus]
MASSGRLLQHRKAFSFVVALVVLVFLVAFKAAYPQYAEIISQPALSTMQKVWPRAEPKQKAFTILLENRQDEALPWNRAEIAALLSELGKYDPALVVLDIDLSQSDSSSPSQNPQLYKAYRGNTASVGLNTPLPDHDDILAETLRTIPTVLTQYSKPSPGGSTTYSAPLEKFSIYARAVARQPAFAIDNDGLFYSVSTQDPLFPSHGIVSTVISTLGNDDGRKLVPPLKEQPEEFFTETGKIILYRSEQFDHQVLSVRSASAATLVDSDLANALKGAVVFVGHQGHPTHIHALAVEQFLQSAFLEKPLWAERAELLITAALGLLVLMTAFSYGSFKGLVVFSGATLILTGWAAWEFASGPRIFDISYAAATAFLVFFIFTTIRIATNRRNKAKLSAAMAGFVAPRALSSIASKPEQLALEGQETEITALRAQIVGFDSLFETHSGTQLVSLCRILSNALSDEIQVNNGTVGFLNPKGLTAFWNAPQEEARHAAVACKTALELRRLIERYNARDMFHFKARGFEEQQLKIAITLASGEATVGNVGPRRRFQYAAVGPAPKQATKATDLCEVVRYPVLVTVKTKEEASEFAYLELYYGPETEKHQHYALIGDASMAFSESFLKLKRTHKQLLAALFETDAEAAEKLLEECKSVAGAELEEFYEALQEHVMALQENAENQAVAAE